MEKIQSSQFPLKVESDEELKNIELDTDMDQTSHGPTSDNSGPNSLGKALKDGDLTSGQNTDRSSLPSIIKKKVQLTNNASLQKSTTSLAKQDDSTETDDKPPDEEEQRKSPLRQLADIKIDLSKIIPVNAQSSRYPFSGWGSSLPTPLPTEPLVPGSSRLHLPLSGPSFTSDPFPVPSQISSFLSGREGSSYRIPAPQPQRRQFSQIDPFEEDSYVEAFCKDVPDGPYLKPTESQCLFQNASRIDEDDLIEWDFDETPITNLSISDSDFELVPRPKTPTPYQVRLEDNAPPHIYDPYTQNFIPLNNGDQIEVVAEIHDDPKEVNTTRERTTPHVRRPMFIPAEREDLEAIERIPTDEDDSSEMDFDEAAFQNWVSPPSPDLPRRRHSF